jgi:hypothetical protein
MSVSEVLPTSLAVVSPYSGEKLRIVHSRTLELEAMDRNTVHACDYATQAVVVLITLRRKYDHVMVKRELCPRGGILPE